MFDLKEQISKWRDNLAASQTLGMSDIDELESHLREEIESLKSAKLSDEEAFIIAAHRLGSPERLADEFAKVGWDTALRYRVSWMITGILAYVLARHFSLLLQKAFIWFVSLRGVQGYALGIIALAFNILVLGSVLFLCCFLWRRALRNNRFRKWAGQLATRRIFLVTAFVFLFVELAARIALPAMTYRVLGPVQYGQEVLFFTCVHLAWSILLPVILVIVLIKLGAAGSREAQAE